MLGQINAKDYTAETLTATSNLLCQNPEYYTIWNDRRLILQDVFSKELAAPPAEESAPPSGLNTAQQEILLLIQEDLTFLLPLLKNFPKCYWIWNHRAWLLQQASEYLPSSSAKTLWQQELGLVSKMLGYDSRNFHGWSYRRQVIRALDHLDHLEHTQKGEGDDAQGQKPTMTEHEFAYTTKMINSNLSNFSAWHNRLQLIPRLLDERNADTKVRRKMLDDEFDFITTALYTDPHDQSLWFYHNWLMCTLIPGVREASAIVLDLTDQDRLPYLDAQFDLLRELLEDNGDCKYIFQALLTYTPQYLEIGAGNNKVTTTEMAEWLHQLEKLDPLRRGRWHDLRTSLNL